jgi:hypothetical protein
MEMAHTNNDVFDLLTPLATFSSIALISSIYTYTGASDDSDLQCHQSYLACRFRREGERL